MRQLLHITRSPYAGRPPLHSQSHRQAHSTMASQNVTTSGSTTLSAAGAPSLHLKPFGPLEPLLASVPWGMFPRVRIDTTYTRIISSLAKCLTMTESQRSEYEDQVTQLWDPTGHTMVTFSVRTAFDLLLQTLALPEGSEILCSAITIQNMLDIIKHHKLVAVPVDLVPETLAVEVSAVRAAVTSKTKAILFTHMHGTRNMMMDVCDLADELNLLVLEDCAQAFIGLQYTGHPRAFASMFSFGGIKTSSAFGGCLVKVHDMDVLNRMKERESQYEARSNAFFAQRVLKFSGIFTVMSPSTYGLFVNACRLFGVEYGEVLHKASRGFLGGELITMIRHRPPLPILPLLLDQLLHFDEANLQLRKKNGDLLVELLEKIPNIQLPGAKGDVCYYWLFPVVVESPEYVVKYLNDRGFDACRCENKHAFVPSPLGPAHDPQAAKFILKQGVFLPSAAETPEWAIRQMAMVLQEAVESSPKNPLTA